MTGLPHFLWGSATSSHQVEGDNHKNDWWAWEKAGKVKEASGTACRHYEFFKDDFAILTQLGHNAHRLSLEWSRLEPEEGKFDDEAFNHYSQVFQELRKRSIEPVVTLHHFTNPQWFAQKGGWAERENIRYFVRYAARAVEAFSPYVRIWITINEPLIYVYFSFLEGSWPPGLKSFPHSIRVIRNLLEAHIESYRKIHHAYEKSSRGPVWVSIAKHVTALQPCRPHSWPDRLAVSLRHWFFNHLFVDAALSGFLFFPGIYCESFNTDRTLDFIGLNYYTRSFVRFTPPHEGLSGFSGGEFLGEMCDLKHHEDQVAETNQMGWDVYPQGLYDLLMRFRKYRLPLIICENGICAHDDPQRDRFIRSHLAECERAKAQGVDLTGYFYWSLLDNFEWAHGFGPRFGIVEVDYQNFQRKIRPSAQTLTALCRKLDSRVQTDAD